MLLNFILFFILTFAIFLLIKQIKEPNFEKAMLPICKFDITKPKFEIENNIRLAKYKITSKGKNRYFKDFPLSFKFYSDHKFKSEIRISYRIPDDIDEETIYSKVVEFDENFKEHIYYINDIIMGSISIEIYTNSEYGKPSIDFEILQGNICHMNTSHKLQIIFPK